MFLSPLSYTYWCGRMVNILSFHADNFPSMHGDLNPFLLSCRRFVLRPLDWSVRAECISCSHTHVHVSVTYGIGSACLCSALYRVPQHSLKYENTIVLLKGSLRRVLSVPWPWLNNADACVKCGPRGKTTPSQSSNRKCACICRMSFTTQMLLFLCIITF